MLIVTVFPFSYLTGTLSETLDKAVSRAVSDYYAPSSWKSKLSAWRKFLEFCASINVTWVPASPITIARYIAYLATVCKLKYSTIVNYVSAVNTLHRFSGSKFYVAQDAFLVQATLKGFRRQLGDSPRRKLPLTPDMLHRIISICDPWEDSGFIAAMLVGFFAMLRKSNLVPAKNSTSISDKHLKRGSFSFTDFGVLLSIQETKTIQFKTRTLDIPLVMCQDSPICPVTALKKHLEYFPTNSMDSPAFWLTKKSNDSPSPLTYSDFSRISSNKLAAIGLDTSQYTSHSLRRGGATFAHQCGAKLESIQKMGDWASLCVLLYLDTPLSHRHNVAQTMANNI